MFAGHYSTAFAARKLKPVVPLWHLFIATQLLDFAWAILVLLGVEKVRVVPHFMEASMLDLYYMPYTHSLPGSLGWAMGAGLLYALWWKDKRKVAAGLIFGAAVLSHWVLDLIVHAPDLLLYPGGPKVGFGLWESLLWSQLIEGGLLLGGVVIYVMCTQPKSPVGRWAPWALFAFMVALQAYNHIPVEAPPSPAMFSIMALFAYSLLALLAWLTDRIRMPRKDPASDEMKRA